MLILGGGYCSHGVAEQVSHGADAEGWLLLTMCPHHQQSKFVMVLRPRGDIQGRGHPVWG